MAEHRYTVLLEYDEEAGSWVAYVPALNWLSDFGATKEEALARVGEAAIGYLEALARRGQAAPAGDPARPFVKPWHEETPAPTEALPLLLAAA